MVDLQALKTELLSGHPVTGAYDANNQLAADQLNAVNRTKLRPLTMTELREWAAVNGRAFKLRQAIDNVALTDQVRNLAIVGDALLSTDGGTLDPGNPVHAALVNELVTAAVWSAADRTELVTKATDNISRAVELGLDPVEEKHVRWARNQ